MENLEDKIYFYIQEIYEILKNIHDYVKENQDTNKLSYLKTGVDGFESANIYFQNIYFKVSDRYANSLYFDYVDELGEMQLPPSLDGLFYGSKIKLTNNSKTVIGVKNMLDKDIISYLEKVYQKLLIYKNINKQEKKVKAISKR